MAISYVDRQAFAVLSPLITRELGVSNSMYGVLLAAFSVAYLLGAPLAGQWVDALGARRGLLYAVLAWSVVAALHAVVPSVGALFALRILLGFAEAPSFPGAAQAVHRVLPPEERARGLGVLFTGSSFGAMIAPLLAGSLATAAGWRTAVLGTALVGLLWVPLWLSTAWSPGVREVLDGERPPSLGPPREGYREPAEALRSSTRRAPFLTLLRHRAVLRAVLAICASAPAFAFVLLWGPRYLHARFGLEPGGAARYLWLPPLLFDLGTVFFGDRAARRLPALGHEPDRRLLGAAVLLALSGAGIFLSNSAWSAVFFMGTAIAGGGGIYALATADMLDRVPEGGVSTAGGLTASAQSLVYILVNPLVGYLLDRGVSYHAVIVGLALWNIPGCVLWMVLRAPQRRVTAS